MNDAKIFLLSEEVGQLAPMIEAGYTQEDILQELLARYSDLLPGDQIDPESPRRWLLVKREQAVPGGAAEGGRWSLDHLFLDQDAIPTFVECKRALDNRGRREVVAQMLDYAANGVEYWAMDRLRQDAAETARLRGKTLDDEIRSLLVTAAEEEIEAFWQKVEINLRAGKVRLVFVGDEIRKELRRLVEFLNDKMADVEVLAVEIKQFLGQGQKVLVPRVVGLTEKALLSKGSASRSGGRTNRQQFLGKCVPLVGTLSEKIFDLAEAKGYSISWGTVGFTVRALLPKENRWVTIIEVHPKTLWCKFGDLPLSKDEMTSLSRDLAAFGVFEAPTEKFMRVILEESKLSRIEEAFKFLFDKVGEIVALH